MTTKSRPSTCSHVLLNASLAMTGYILRRFASFKDGKSGKGFYCNGTTTFSHNLKFQARHSYNFAPDLLWKGCLVGAQI
jgi:hypothetical protein